MSQFKVSIIIPFFNAEDYILDCLDCLINQTLKKIEIIFVNDGSTDSGANIITEVSKNLDNVIIINKKNSGVSDTRNLGLKNARGEYIYFLDADDTISINALELVYSDAIKYAADIVVFDSINIKQFTDCQIDFDYVSQEQLQGGVYSKRSIPLGKVFEGRQFIVDSLNTPESFFPPVWLALFKKSLILGNDILFEKIIYEDNIFSMDIVFAAKSIIYRSEILHFRRIVSSSITHQKKTEKHVVGAMRVMEHAAEIYDRESVIPKNKAAFQRWNLICAGNSFHDILLLDKSLRRKYKWKYIRFLVRGLKKYSLKLLIKAIVKL